MKGGRLYKRRGEGKGKGEGYIRGEGKANGRVKVISEERGGQKEGRWRCKRRGEGK